MYASSVSPSGSNTGGCKCGGIGASRIFRTAAVMLMHSRGLNAISSESLLAQCEFWHHQASKTDPFPEDLGEGKGEVTGPPFFMGMGRNAYNGQLSEVHASTCWRQVPA